MKQLGVICCYNDYIGHNSNNDVANNEEGANADTNVVDTLGGIRSSLSLFISSSIKF